ncbi:MAG: hypothetical protein MJ137_04775 [Clostridia bacterium]|nr:hypothetical protein [Clostridia bacterium]
MKKLFRTLTVSLLALLLCVSAFSLVSCTATESAKTLFQKGLSRTAAKYENIDVVSTVEKIATGGSVEFLVDDIEIDEDTKGNASVKFFANTSKNTAAVILNAKLGEDKYDAAAYISSSAAVVKFEKLLGKDAYGINFSKAEKNLKTSVFGPDSDSDYAVSEEIYNQILDAIKSFNDAKNVEKDAKSLSDKYIKKLYKLISDNASFEKENSETTVLSEKNVPCTVVTVKVDDKCLTKVVSELWKDAKKDSALKKFIDANVIAQTPYEDVGDLYDAIDEIVDGMVDSLEDSGVNFTLKYYLNKSSGAIMKAEVSTKAGGEKVAYGIELGINFKDFEGIKVYTKVGTSTDYIWLKVVENNKEGMKLSLEATMKGVPAVTVKYTKEDGIVKITVSDDGDETVIKMSYKKKSSTYTFGLESVTVNGEKATLPGKISVIVNTKAKAPSAPSKYVDILTMKEDSFEDFLDDVKDNISDLPAGIIS